MMPRFQIQDFRSLHNAKPLQQQMQALIDSSLDAQARVEGLNEATGQYRVTIEGTLDRSNESRFGWQPGQSYASGQSVPFAQGFAPNQEK